MIKVGDCGAVLGSFVPSPMLPHSSDTFTGESSFPTAFSPLDWNAELLINPHNADNDLDVHRLRSSHPVHESAFVLRDDRLLGQ